MAESAGRVVTAALVVVPGPGAAQYLGGGWGHRGGGLRSQARPAGWL